jgi:hypothetical protein
MEECILHLGFSSSGAGCDSLEEACFLWDHMSASRFLVDVLPRSGERARPTPLDLTNLSGIKQRAIPASLASEVTRASISSPAQESLCGSLVGAHDGRPAPQSLPSSDGEYWEGISTPSWPSEASRPLADSSDIKGDTAELWEEPSASAPLGRRWPSSRTDVQRPCSSTPLSPSSDFMDMLELVRTPPSQSLSRRSSSVSSASTYHSALSRTTSPPASPESAMKFPLPSPQHPEASSERSSARAEPLTPLTVVDDLPFSVTGRTKVRQRRGVQHANTCPSLASPMPKGAQMAQTSSASAPTSPHRTPSLPARSSPTRAPTGEETSPLKRVRQPSRWARDLAAGTGTSGGRGAGRVPASVLPLATSQSESKLGHPAKHASISARRVAPTAALHSKSGSSPPLTSPSKVPSRASAITAPHHIVASASCR